MEDKQGLGGESVFEFKYIPDLTKTTKAERGRGALSKPGGVEQRNLRAFCLGCVLIPVTFWMTIKLLLAIGGGVAAGTRITSG